MIQTCYETQHLLLRAPDPSMAEACLDYYVRNADFLKPYEPSRDASFFTIDAQRQSLRMDRQALEDGQGVRLYLMEKDHPDRIIGTVALTGIVYGAFLSCFLGYKLDQDVLRRGYASEAIGQLIQIGFEELKLHRIEANIMPRNEPSMALARKLGFVEEGISRKYLRINGVWEDHIHMVLIHDET